MKQESQRPAGTMMVFCNSSSTCFYLGHILEEHAVRPAIINGQMTEKVRNVLNIKIMLYAQTNARHASEILFIFTSCCFCKHARRYGYYILVLS